MLTETLLWSLRSKKKLLFKDNNLQFSKLTLFNNMLTANIAEISAISPYSPGG